MELKTILSRFPEVRALVVDDEVLLRDLFIQALKVWGIQVDACASVEEALPYLQSHTYQVALVDIHLPGEDGSWLLPFIVKFQPNAAIMMVTGDRDIRTAIRCLTSGAFDFLLKPIDLEVLRAKLTAGLEYMALKQERRHYLEQMEEMAAAERMKSHQTFMSAIDALIRALEAKDLYTKGHSSRVAIIAEGIATSMNLKPHEIDEIVTAARCHDIGKIGVADQVLLKKGSLTEAEFDHIRAHPTIGARILSPIFQERPDVVLSVRHHHERFDGTGYPDSLAADDIPLGARVIAVADAYDAMTSNRVYRNAKSNRIAVNDIIKGAGQQFCPSVVRGFMRFMSHLPYELSSGSERWVDKRREPRHEHNIPLVLSPSNQSSVSCETLDVSSSGLRVLMSGELQVGGQALVDLGEVGVQAGVVQWARECNESGAQKCEAGLRLTSVELDYLKMVQRLALREEDRRLDRRIERVIPANIVTPTSAFKLSLLNVSMEGAFVQTREPLIEGETIRLSFALPGREALGDVEMEARVVHTITLKQATRSPHLIPGMGVEFIGFFGESRAQLHDFMLSRFYDLAHEQPASLENDDVDDGDTPLVN